MAESSSVQATPAVHGAHGVVEVERLLDGGGRELAIEDGAEDLDAGHGGTMEPAPRPR
jgi:hypothetical protein